MHAALTMTISILKLRIGSFVALAALVGILSAEGGMGWGAAVAFTLAVLGASGAAGAFNQYFERETDRLMARTHTRPFACGTLKAGPIWPVTFSALLAVSLLLAWATGGTLAAVLVFAGAATYGLLYTLVLKTRTVWNVVIGGASGSFALLAGAVAAAPEFGPVLGPVPILLAAVLFLWTPPHFWALAIANRADYAQAGVPMLPVVVGNERAARIVFGSTVALLVASLLPAFWGAGPVYFIGALGGGLHFVHKAWVLSREVTRAHAMSAFFASLVQLSTLLVAACVDGLVR